MKKIVNESINEGFQQNLDEWMEKKGIQLDPSDPTETIYALCKVIYDLEQLVYARTPIRGSIR